MATQLKHEPANLVVPRGNYISQDFLMTEKEKLWPKVWQVACRTEEVAQPGDYVTYNIADDSIIITRAKDGTIRAYHNVCPHRGRRLADGCGRASQFRCQYHGWSFGLDGRNIQVQDRADWGSSLTEQELTLHSVKTDQWGGFVWINMDSACEPLSDYLETIPQFLDPFEYEGMRYRWNLQLTLPCNWKVALEAFMEGYHVATTHPQLLQVQGDDYTQSYAQGKHAHFGYFSPTAPVGSPSPRLNEATPSDMRPGIVEFFRQLEHDLGAIVTDRDFEAAKGIMDVVPADADAMVAFGTAIELGRAAAEAEGAGYPPGLDFGKFASAGADWHIFPNCVTLPWFDGAIWYRARPNGDNPDSCIFDIWSLKRFAPGKEPPVERRVVEDITGQDFGLILNQDIANMEAVQRGMKSRAFSHARPNPVQEVEVSNFHEVLQRYIDAD